MHGPALFFTSVLFSIVHFLKPPADDVGPIDWLSGFRALPTCFEKFSEPALLGAGFTTLVFIGWVLGCGPDAEVLAPPELRQEVLARVEAAVEAAG